MPRVRYQSGSACFDSMEAANIATGTAASGTIWQTTQRGPVQVDFQYATDSTIYYELRPLLSNDYGPRYSSEVAITPPECQIPDVMDGIELGWMVGAVWIAVYCVVFITRLLKSDMEERFNDPQP